MVKGRISGAERKKVMMRNFHRVVAPLCSIVFRLVLAIIFFYAGIEKIIDPKVFAVAVYNYQLLPDFAVNTVAVILPWLEVLIATCLLTGYYVRGAAVISSGLFLTFASALTINLVRGLDISCGCFGASSGSINWLYLVRDLSLLSMSVFVLIYYRDWRHLIALKSRK
jgi:uncharacterized membrane protein YphA (DoxX/SURF4 family)